MLYTAGESFLSGDFKFHCRDLGEALYPNLHPILSNFQSSYKCKSINSSRERNLSKWKTVYSLFNEEKSEESYRVDFNYWHFRVIFGYFILLLGEEISQKGLSALRKCFSEINAHFHPIISGENSNYRRNLLFIASLFAVWPHAVWQFVFFLRAGLLLLAWQEAPFSRSTAIKSLTCVSCAALRFGDKVGLSQLRALVFRALLSRAFGCDEASQMTRKTYSHVKYPCWSETRKGKWKLF